MKTIGLIGGTSWYSTIDYYRIINETTANILGGNSSAKILLYSVDFSEIVTLTKQQDWDGIAEIMATAAKKLEVAGADCLLLCANTMHIIAEKVQAQINIPLLHIADVVLNEIAQQAQLKTVLLLGTKYTMQSSFYTNLFQQQGIRIVVPDALEMELINDSIYNELGKGVLLPQTKNSYLQIINRYINENNVQGIILGCTEIPLLIKQADCTVPVYDTTLLHARAAVNFALNKSAVHTL